MHMARRRWRRTSRWRTRQGKLQGRCKGLLLDCSLAQSVQDLPRLNVRLLTCSIGALRLAVDKPRR